MVHVCPNLLSYSIWAAVAKYHRLSIYRNKFISCNFGSWKSSISRHQQSQVAAIFLVHSQCHLAVSSYGGKSKGAPWSFFWKAPVSFMGEGDGIPLQYSCLENPMDGEPGRLQSMGSHRVGHDWVTSLSLFTFMHWRRKWQPTPVFLPGESQGRGSLVGCRLWGRTRLKRLSSSSSSSLIYEGSAHLLLSSLGAEL